jgi:hypothetical protein
VIPPPARSGGAISDLRATAAALVVALDDEDLPAAETCRLVGAAAAELGLLRPSYQHVRRIVRVERRRQELRREARKVLAGAVSTSAAGLVPSVVLVLERLRELQLAEELVLQEHLSNENRALVRRA